MLGPGSLIEIDIEKPAAGGRMLGRHHGEVVLVSGTLPGERVRARVQRVGKGVAFADAEDVLVASADRRAAADRTCGGNVLAHIAYPRQLEIKGEIIRDAFGRIGRMPIPRPEVVASPESGYRMRARLHAHGGRVGFYREGTHQLCDPAATGQLLEQTSVAIARMQEQWRSSLADVASAVSAIDIAESVDGNQRACHLELDRPVDASRFAALSDDLTGLSAGASGAPDMVVIAGTPTIVDTIAVHGSTVTLQRGVRAFFQANRYLLAPLVHEVIAHLVPGPVVDLYAGVGLFGLSGAAAGLGPVRLVEGDPVSGSDLEANAAPFGERARVERRSVEQFLERRRRDPARGSTYIVDPPRTGLSRPALAALVDAAPPRLVYVSCDPATLARDARLLLDAGYSPGPLRGFDLFPNTAHVETVAVFTR
jgi:23S rRNA (uracil1939-C5)-methyltransferase